MASATAPRPREARRLNALEQTFQVSIIHHQRKTAASQQSSTISWNEHVVIRLLSHLRTMGGGHACAVNTLVEHRPDCLSAQIPPNVHIETVPRLNSVHDHP